RQNRQKEPQLRRVRRIMDTCIGRDAAPVREVSRLLNPIKCAHCPITLPTTTGCWSAAAHCGPKPCCMNCSIWSFIR
ncbi:MAG: hypothetical protein PHO66_09045, partial [Eubacteriales bacterium]|nr:hypothetical protein [Eubacteriales bacterium]